MSGLEKNSKILSLTKKKKKNHFMRTINSEGSRISKENCLTVRGPLLNLQQRNQWPII